MIRDPYAMDAARRMLEALEVDPSAVMVSMVATFWQREVRNDELRQDLERKQTVIHLLRRKV